MKHTLSMSLLLGLTILAGCSKSLQQVEKETYPLVQELVEKQNKEKGLIYQHQYEIQQYNVFRKEDNHHYSGSVGLKDARINLCDKYHKVDTISNTYDVIIEYAEDNHAVSVQIDFSELGKLFDLYQQLYH